MAPSKVGLDQLPSGRWRARYRDSDGRQHSRAFPTFTEASKWRKKQVGSLTEGTHVAPNNPTTVGDYALRHAAARVGADQPTTARRRAGSVQRHVVDSILGPMRLVDVRHSDVEAWVAERTAVGLGPAAVRLELGALRTILRSAVKDTLITASPAAGKFPLPRPTAEPVVPLLPEQVRALVAATPECLQAAIWWQVCLGLRMGEVCGQRLGDIDFLRRTVRVERQFTKGSTAPSAPKSGKARVVPVPQFALDVLAAHLARWPADADGGLFRTPAGRLLRHNNYNHVFAAAVAKAGLPKGTTSHDLRHTYASMLLAAGESVFAVADRLGHVNAKLVLTTYGHLMGDRHEQTRLAIDGAFGAATVEATPVPAGHVSGSVSRLTVASA